METHWHKLIGISRKISKQLSDISRKLAQTRLHKQRRSALQFTMHPPNLPFALRFRKLSRRFGEREVEVSLSTHKAAEEQVKTTVLANEHLLMRFFSTLKVLHCPECDLPISLPRSLR